MSNARTHGLSESCNDRAGYEHHSQISRRCANNPLFPHLRPNTRKPIVERSGLCPIPGRVSTRDLPVRMQRVRTERDQTGEATKQRDGALDGHMGTAFLTRHVQTPARRTSPMISSAGWAGSVETMCGEGRACQGYLVFPLCSGSSSRRNRRASSGFAQKCRNCAATFLMPK